MLLTAFGAFLGASLSILVAIAIEYLRKPKLEVSVEDPPTDVTYPNAPATHGRFVRVVVLNKAMPRGFRWLGRSAAYQCTGQVQFHHIDNGAPVFSRSMPARWAGSDEPLSYHVVSKDQIAQILDPAKYNAAFRRDCFPGNPENVDIAARFDDENYLPGKGWRNPEFKLPQGRYLIKVTIQFAGEQVMKVFRLENSVARQHFRLSQASNDESARVLRASRL